MKTFKQICILCLAAVLVVGLLACNKNKDADKPKLDPDAPAFKLGDLVATVGELEAAYNGFIGYMQQYGMPAPTDEAEIAEYVQMALDQMLANYAILWKAEEMGVTLTNVQLAEIDDIIAGERQDIIDYYMTLVGEETTDPAELEEAALALIDEEIKGYYGDEMSLDKYLEDYKKDMINQVLTEAVQGKVALDVTVSDEDVKAWYEGELKAHEEAFAEAPVDFKAYMQQFEQGFSTLPALTVPEGFAKIALITIASEEEVDESYTTGKETMAKLEAEYGKLMLAGGADADRLKEIRDEYAQLKADTDALYETFAEGPKAKADAAAAELAEEGADFDAIMGKYNKDEAKDIRYLYLTETDPSVPEAVWSAAAELEAGAFSDIIEIEGTFYIVKLIEILPAGPVPLKDVLEAATAAALLERQDVVWGQRQSDWLEEAQKVVVYYPENYAMVGR